MPTTAITADDVQVPFDPQTWRSTRWVGAIAGHVTTDDLLAGVWLAADHHRSVTRVYAAACADLAQATLAGLPSRSPTWERWFAGLRSAARELSPARGNPHVAQRALFHGARLEGQGATWTRQLRRGFSALLAASLPEPVPALIGEDLATFRAVDAAWLDQHPRLPSGDGEIVRSQQDPHAYTATAILDPSGVSHLARTATVLWPIATLRPNPVHPRVSLDPKAIAELAASISAHSAQGGILQSLLVTTDGTVVAGHRRLAAARLAGMVEVPVIVRELSRAQQLEIILTDSVQHQDLSPVEEARGYQSLIAEGYTQAAIARAVGTTTVRVASRLVLLELDRQVQERVHRGELPLGVGPVLAALDDPVRQRRLAMLAVRRRLSVPQLRRLVDQARGTLAHRRSPTLPSDDEPDGGGLSRTRQALLEALRTRPEKTFTFGELAAVTERTCCACGMASLPAVCSACPLVDMLTAVISHTHNHAH